MLPRRLPGSIALAGALALGVVLDVRSDDLTADYRPANPAGAWRWGWSERLDAPFRMATGYPAAGQIDQWLGGGNAGVAFNRTQRIQSSGTAVVPPGTLVLHPGEQGQVAIVRWTAGRAGIVRVDAMFRRRDPTWPTTTDVHVLRDGRSVFDGVLDEHRDRAAFSSLVSVRAGSVLDFAVGFGANGHFRGDATGLELRIEPADRIGEEAVKPR